MFIALGAWIVADRGPGGRRLPGFVMIGVASLLLLNNFGIVRVRVWELFWPLVIVLVGAKLLMQRPGLWRDRHGRPGVHAPHTTEAVGNVSSSDGTISMFSVLGGSKRASDDKPFRGGEITALMGGTHLDLRQATIEPGEHAVINVFSMMGGHEIWVPPGWTVVLDVMPVLGSVEDKRLPAIDTTPRPPNYTPPRLVLRGVVVMGGVTIKN
ncbi:MAG TPA: DUF5668 domain-containing protein [Vicinamibacterales bacterium]|nr:DUF5668 domain-containing protein [Vicinamibacterales bacterium]